MSLASSARRMALGSAATSAAALAAAAVVIAAQATTPVSAQAVTPVAATTSARLGVEQRNTAIIRRMYADVFGTGGAGGRIVEHWAVVEDVPATSVSGNSMFSDLYRYDGTPPPVSAAREDANKQLVHKAWAAGFSAHDVSVVDRYWAPGNDYLQPGTATSANGNSMFSSLYPAS